MAENGKRHTLDADSDNEQSNITSPGKYITFGGLIKFKVPHESNQVIILRKKSVDNDDDDFRPANIVLQNVTADDFVFKEESKSIKTRLSQIENCDNLTLFRDKVTKDFAATHCAIKCMNKHLEHQFEDVIQNQKKLFKETERIHSQINTIQQRLDAQEARQKLTEERLGRVVDDVEESTNEHDEQLRSLEDRQLRSLKETKESTNEQLRSLEDRQLRSLKETKESTNEQLRSLEDRQLRSLKETEESTNEQLSSWKASMDEQLSTYNTSFFDRLDFLAQEMNGMNKDIDEMKRMMEENVVLVCSD
jgi:chromosome segregation ATPase